MFRTFTSSSQRRHLNKFRFFLVCFVIFAKFIQPPLVHWVNSSQSHGPPPRSRSEEQLMSPSLCPANERRLVLSRRRGLPSHAPQLLSTVKSFNGRRPLKQAFSSYCCSHTESAARRCEAITLTAEPKPEPPDKTF